MSGQTLTEKILLRKVNTPVLPGSEYFRIPVDLALGHDATIALLIERFKKTGRHIWDPSRCFFAADHFVPPSTPERADILNRFLSFVKEESVPEDLLYRGISHQLLVEDRRCQPGMVICGADSHTVMAGALGCFATGMGSTDIMATLLTGDVIAPVPKSILVRLTGKIPPWLFGKDIALEIIRRIGEGGAVAHALEYHDQTEPGLSMDSRFAVSNMSVEAGATNGIFAPDDALKRYLARRDASGEGNGRAADARFEAVWLDPDPDADYARKLEINVEDAHPLVALPGDLSRIVPINEVERRPIQQVFVGSCAGGRVEDLAIVARLLRNRRVAQGVMLVVTPASQTVYYDCLRNGIFRVLAEAGALITNSSCGACGGIDKGLIGAGQACLSTSNRNFRGRMGSPDGLIYLASPLAAAAAAITGRLTDPRPLLADAGIDDFHADPWPGELEAEGERP
ncbi:MAG TPA: aconitase/3-isopropylmalate dehydratase large subunit family protein [Blastocatellia bacterium]|nr:aconitase/3-isopropylmalate dehydratase large subunit family protein [Blastocatellia bacterium]